jgi:hypothetical protein
MPPEALRNYQAMSRMMTERGHVRLTEGELIAMWNVDKPLLAGTPGMDARTSQAIMASLDAPNYPAIEIPALAIYALADPRKPLPPWYDTRDAGLMATLTEIGRITRNFQRENIERFRREVKTGEVLELRNADHYVIQSNQPEVLDAIESFDAKLKEP